MSHLRETPNLSILVATWNCADQLASFLASLLSQSYDDWELILLDNSSSDHSEIVVREAAALDSQARIVWSSVPDNGIYDAWNRGLSLARGRYFCFIGADDTFVSSNSLALIAQLTCTAADLITAKNSYYSSQGRFLRDWGFGWGWRRMRQSMNIAHPGLLIRREWFERLGGFDPSYRICGDYEWLLRLPPQLRTVHVSDPILKIVQAGLSHTCIGAVYAETFRAQCGHIGLVSSACFWCLNWLKYFRRRLIGLA